MTNALVFLALVTAFAPPVALFILVGWRLLRFNRSRELPTEERPEQSIHGRVGRRADSKELAQVGLYIVHYAVFYTSSVHLLEKEQALLSNNPLWATFGGGSTRLLTFREPERISLVVKPGKADITLEYAFLKGEEVHGAGTLLEPLGSGWKREMESLVN